MLKSIGLYLIFLICGITFIMSAYLKLFPIEIFEFAIADIGIFSWTISALLSRLIIGFELLLGIMLITKLMPRITILASIATLVLFSVYLLITIILKGNFGNCNCFGIHYAMTPLESIVKNIILILLLVGLFFFNKPKKNKILLKRIIASVIVVFAFTITFILAPLHASNYEDSEEIGNTIDFSMLYEDDYEHIPSVNLTEDKWMVFFVSASCTHCINAGYKVSILYNRIPDLPIYMFINGDENDIESYHEKTNTQNIPYSMMPAEQILYYTSGRLPLIYFVNSQIIEKKVNYYHLDDDMIKEWLEN